MVKINENYASFSISMPTQIYLDYIEGIKGNRSVYIWNMMVKGIQSEQGELENNKAKISNLLREVHNSKEEIKKLNLQLASLKAKMKPEEDPELTEAKALSDAIGRSGILENVGK